MALVNSEEDDERNENWLGRNDLSEEEFKKKLIFCLKINNLQLTSSYDNIVSTSWTRNNLDTNVDENVEPAGLNSLP